MTYTYRFSDYYKKHRPREYPSTHKRCMECGEIIPWEDDCSWGHFKEIGREMRQKAMKVESLAGKRKSK